MDDPISDFEKIPDKKIKESLLTFGCDTGN